MPKLKPAPLPTDKLLPRLTLAFFDRARTTAVIWFLLVIFGIASYSTLLRREGFPSVNIPLTFVSGTYFVNDAQKVDSEVAAPLAGLALEQSSVDSVQTQSDASFFTLNITYKEGTDSRTAARDLEQRVKDAGRLPTAATVQYSVPYFGATGGDVQQLDLAISFYRGDNSDSPQRLSAKAQEAATWLRAKQLPGVKDVFVKELFGNATDPATGQSVSVQKNFDRFGERHDGQTRYYNSVIIGVAASDNVDVLKLDRAVQTGLGELLSQTEFDGYHAAISASFAPQIRENLSELQRVLLEGLIAVLVVGSIVIAVRASLITVLSMITVILITLGLLVVVGYSLNVITLFALILALSLIVDDTIIMVEAIDAARHRTKDRRKAVQEAARKVSRAMMAATATAALSFAPLLFVGGVLGSFIRAIPVTIISALIISLIVALVFIPLMGRLLLLGKKQMGAKGVTEVAAGFENRIANFLARPMLWAQHSKRKLFAVGTTAVLIGLSFFVGGLFVARNVVFNIFPPTKDTNGLILQMNFPPGTTLEAAQAIAGRADSLASDFLGSNFERGAYYSSGSAGSAIEQIQIVSYNDREIKSPQLVSQLQDKFNLEFSEAQVVVGQLDVGPPSASFIVEIDSTNRAAAFNLANDMAEFMKSVELKRPSGRSARLININVSSPDQYIRAGNNLVVSVNAGFDGSDTSTLVTLAQDAITNRYDRAKLAEFGLPEDAVGFNLGQESENQDSFKTLALAFPIMLVVMYLLLAVEFRSLLQPLLIFMAIPFSIFGIMVGLNITDNAISFFAMLGFFALVGLSIKNTILLTDYANQSRRAGNPPVQAAIAALHERFRPLFATSVTAVVSLIPLAISSPFWEGLAVVLIFGLLSSTFLVLTVFPYYYLGGEYLRQRFSFWRFLKWLVPSLILVGSVGWLTNYLYAIVVAPLIWWLLHSRLSRRFLS